MPWDASGSSSTGFRPDQTQQGFAGPPRGRFLPPNSETTQWDRYGVNTGQSRGRQATAWDNPAHRLDIRAGRHEQARYEKMKAPHFDGSDEAVDWDPWGNRFPDHQIQNGHKSWEPQEQRQPASLPIADGGFSKEEDQDYRELLSVRDSFRYTEGVKVVDVSEDAPAVADENNVASRTVLYVQDSLEGKPEVLLHPNTLHDDGTVALSENAVSEDGKYLAYGNSSSGSDWVTIKVIKIDYKTTEPDVVSWVKFSGISWTHDGKGFFNSRYPAPKEDHDNPKHSHSASVTEDGKYVLLYIGESCDPVNKVYYCDLSLLSKELEGCRGTKELLPFIRLVDNFDASYHYVANDETNLIFLTSKEAPRYKLVRVDLTEPNSWTVVLQEDKKDVLESASAVSGNRIVVNYLSDVKNVLHTRDLRTGDLLHHLPLDIGTVSEIFARRKDSRIFIGFTSFLVPGIIYMCKLEGDMSCLNEKIDHTKYAFGDVILFGHGQRMKIDEHTEFCDSREQKKPWVEACLVRIGDLGKVEMADSKTNKFHLLRKCTHRAAPI
ncbi:hypothetical protein SASPL_148074 [Salvia splendens]|uniref:Peptidase S9A N-terminal domain-containing protein n=1 Tax=Salvia splendens TaxID=180675 RepID=A0A8X8Z3C2_SALSN|nr:hypothetical protein SASPL_148074 [Salvia splendens]